MLARRTILDFYCDLAKKYQINQEKQQNLAKKK